MYIKILIKKAIVAVYDDEGKMCNMFDSDKKFALWLWKRDIELRGDDLKILKKRLDQKE